MTVAEVIAELQNYPMDAEVFCMVESSDWVFNGEYSVEQTTCEEEVSKSVERFDHPYIKNCIAVKIC